MTEVVKVSQDDVQSFDEVLKLFYEVFGEEHKAIPSKEEQKELLGSPYFCLFIAKKGDEIVGGLTVYMFSYYTDLKKIAYIFDLAVKSTFQNQGIGTQLVQYVKEYFTGRGFDEIFVQADKADSLALAFYRKLGAVEENVSHFYFSLK